jgi:y4mF family transcriptional regulator
MSDPDQSRPFGHIAARTSPPSLPTMANTLLTATSDLGALICARRKAMALTQQQFADLSGVGRRFVSELESGKPTLEFGRVLKVCQSVGIDLIAAAR